MRLHRLEVSAFGPFPGTEIVDFDELSSAGLFLFTGQTGAGKTSILDAICFAFFGAVPGARNSAKSFKSHHAKDDATPSVVLEVTLRDRRLRLRRIPAWQRPSSRAKVGFVEEKAKASVEELTAGRWVTHSARADEVGDLVSQLMGMNKDQFCQVVMLPQGQFQTFLRSGARERHDVLESLFDTQRFADVERWLVERRRALDVRCREGEAGIDRLLARAHEVGAVRHIELSSQTETGPSSVSPLSHTDSVTALERQAVDLRAWAASTHDDAQEGAGEAKRCQHALDTARGLADRQHQHREALNRLEALQSTHDVANAREHRVVRARAAAAFAPVLRLVDETDEALSAAQRRVSNRLVSESVQTVLVRSPDDDPPTAHAVRHVADALRAELTRLTSLQELERDLDEALETLHDLDAAIERDGASLEELRAVLHAVPAEIESANQLVMHARDASMLLPAARDTVTETTRVHDAARLAVTLREDLAAVEAQQLSAREQGADARELWNDVRERYIGGMAALLAGGLTDAEPCPVCGSHDHPVPAAPTDDQVSADDEASALERLQRAEQQLSDVVVRRARLDAELTAASDLAGDRTAEAASADLDQARDHLAELADRAEKLPSHQAQLRQLLLRQQDLSAQREQLDDSFRASNESRTSAATMAQRQLAQIEAAVGRGVRLDARFAELAEQVHEIDALLEVSIARDHAEASREAACGRLTSLVSDSMFATVKQVRDAMLTQTEIANEDALNRAYAAELAAASRLLRDPVLVEAADAPEPDLEHLQLIAEQASSAHTAASSKAASLESSASRLDALVVELSVALSRCQPLIAERDLVDQVATMCAGTSRDNVTKTRLSHYVLGARLEQVVAAANVRLSGICGGRFQLEHTLTRGVGDARGGLGLRVIDTYTDRGRDPATLSGGETFYVALALALGLGDLVNNEIGGAELSTLFVDEGFGSLDAETLDEVMDELDALRSGGRTVGLVSHLSELRTRIPSQLSVVRTSRGSHLADSR
ncbi:MAG: SMC family ATPase [Nocardioidaceae bacterium]